MASTRGLSRVHVGEIVTPDLAIRRTASLTLNVRRWLPTVVQTTIADVRPTAGTYARDRPNLRGEPREPERVALVHRNFNLSGSLERSMVILARELVGMGLDVHCYGNPATRTAEVPGVTFHDVSPLRSSSSRFGYPLECGSFALAATRALRRDRERYRFDIVDVCGIAAWEHDVVTVHEVAQGARRRWPEEGGRAFRCARARAALAPVLGPQVGLFLAIQKRQFRPMAYRRLVAVAPEVRDDLVAFHRVPPDAIDVVPPPVELEPFRARDGACNGREQLGIGERERMLVFVGGAFRRKGLGIAIEALAVLPPDVRLVVVGGVNGAELPFVQQAERLGVGRRVHFVGTSDGASSYLRGADAFVLPTLHDGWGITLIEAMAAGVPVVTTTAAGAARVVQEAQAGIVLDHPTAKDVGKAVASLLNAPALRAAMGDRGRIAAERFGSSRQAAATLDVYRRASEEPAGRRPA